METKFKEILARCSKAQHLSVGTLPNGKQVRVEWMSTGIRRVSYDGGPWVTPNSMRSWCAGQDARAATVAG